MKLATFQKRYPTMFDRLQQDKYWLGANGPLLKIKHLEADYAANILGYVIRTTPRLVEDYLREVGHPLINRNEDPTTSPLVRYPMTFVLESPLVKALVAHIEDEIADYLESKARKELNITVFGDIPEIEVRRGPHATGHQLTAGTEF